jgi:hypothetical protein
MIVPLPAPGAAAAARGTPYRFSKVNYFSYSQNITIILSKRNALQILKSGCPRTFYCIQAVIESTYEGGGNQQEEWVQADGVWRAAGT